MNSSSGASDASTPPRDMAVQRHMSGLLEAAMLLSQQQQQQQQQQQLRMLVPPYTMTQHMVQATRVVAASPRDQLAALSTCIMLQRLAAVPPLHPAALPIPPQRRAGGKRRPGAVAVAVPQAKRPRVATSVPVAAVSAATPPPRRAFSCPWGGCSLAYTTKIDLLRHFMKHTGEFPFRCAMPECGRPFKRQYYLKRHHESVHAGCEPAFEHDRGAYARNKAAMEAMGEARKRGRRSSSSSSSSSSSAASTAPPSPACGE